MKTLFSTCCTILILITCQLTDVSADKAFLAGKVERNLTITIGREFGTGFGEELGEGKGHIQKTDSFLTLRVGQFTSSINTPRIMRTLGGSIEGQLFQNNPTIGDTWEKLGHRGGTEQVTLEGYEDVKLSNKVFPKCIKHKTVITDANREHYSELDTIGCALLSMLSGLDVCQSIPFATNTRSWTFTTPSPFTSARAAGSGSPKFAATITKSKMFITPSSFKSR